ncbi:hypothetical protein RFN29_33385 [Mesorhizobium sp. VK22B]|uniref:Uncharacterized protein n=1 Tax=Mesorhizobium captivum TaxID=3072319 RepID=A0ABU4ZBZ9_9HYPH|nr:MULTISPECIES: hypothetical protein [unclassified Mesorhizobium]MDX8496416.1 hypothetical protein [Mesorhizobium sp. VK22B]MDX8509926.1 hypothetical protein [Mesorhizobium sp. VK22E]
MPVIEVKRRVTTSRISRRALLFHSGSAVVASTVAATAHETEPARWDQEPSKELPVLIEAHKRAYEAFGRAVHQRGGNSRDYNRASRAEERALLASCAYPAVSEGD